VDKIYCGSAKTISTKYGEIVSASLNFDVLEQAVLDYGFKKKNGEQIVKIKIQERKSVDNFGNTHVVIIDTWKPEKKDSHIPF
jgi:hypothetical protein